MQKDKHNIYTKEELLKLIKEGKNAPADMDEFDREAFEGLKMLDKPELLDDLNEEVDAIVSKEKSKKTIYYFSAAASLLLIIGLIFVFKNEAVTTITENKKPIASAENLKKAEETNQLGTTTTQPETQTTYEAKEPESPHKEAHKNKQSFLAQSAPAQVPAEEKMQAAKQVSTISEDKPDTKTALSEKEDNYENSKNEVAQTKQVQQGLVVAETTVANNEANDSEADKDKAKKEDAASTGNTTPSAPSIAIYDAKAKSNVSSLQKTASDEEQKSTYGGIAYSSAPKKKTAANHFGKPAGFIGGDSAFVAYAKQHLKISSPLSSGIIVVEFLITKTGKAENIKIVKPLVGCDSCSQDVIDLIKSVEKWQPEENKGNANPAYKKISVRYN